MFNFEAQITDPREQMALGNAKTISNFADIHLTPEQTLLYAKLRTQQNNRQHVSDINPGVMGDQELLAAVLEKTGDSENLSKLKKAYPHTFGLPIGGTSQLKQ